MRSLTEKDPSFSGMEQVFDGRAFDFSSHGIHDFWQEMKINPDGFAAMFNGFQYRKTVQNKIEETMDAWYRDRGMTMDARKRLFDSFEDWLSHRRALRLRPMDEKTAKVLGRSEIESRYGPGYCNHHPKECEDALHRAKEKYLLQDKLSRERTKLPVLQEEFEAWVKVEKKAYLQRQADNVKAFFLGAIRDGALPEAWALTAILPVKNAPVGFDSPAIEITGEMLAKATVTAEMRGGQLELRIQLSGGEPLLLAASTRTQKGGFYHWGIPTYSEGFASGISTLLSNMQGRFREVYRDVDLRYTLAARDLTQDLIFKGTTTSGQAHLMDTNLPWPKLWLKYSADEKVLTGVLAKSVLATINHDIGKIHDNDQINLWWWGVQQDPEFWKKREALALAAKRPRWRAPHRSWWSDAREAFKALFSGAIGFRGKPSAGAGSSRRDMPGFHYEDGAPHNKRLPGRKAGEEPLLKVKSLKTAERPPVFLNLEDVGRDPGKPAVPVNLAESAGLSAGDASVRVETGAPMESLGNRIVIPTPERHILRDLQVRDSKGELLKVGEDYRITTRLDDETYAIELLKGGADSTYAFTADFARARELPRPRDPLRNLDIGRIRELAGELRDAGFKATSGALFVVTEAKARLGLPITAGDLNAAFALSATYSNVRESEAAIQAAEALAAKGNRFGKYAKFLRGGVVCAQCDGGNALFAEFLEGYFKGDPRVEIRRMGGFANPLTNLGNLGPGELHAVTGVRVDGIHVATYDATPRWWDPRNVKEWEWVQKLMNLRKRRGLVAAAEAGRETLLGAEEVARLKKELEREVDHARKWATSLIERRGTLIQAAKAASGGRFRELQAAPDVLRIVRVTGTVEDWVTGRIDWPEARERLRVAMPWSLIPEDPALALQVLQSEALRMQQELDRSIGRLRATGEFNVLRDPRVYDAATGVLISLRDQAVQPESFAKLGMIKDPSCIRPMLETIIREMGLAE